MSFINILVACLCFPFGIVLSNLLLQSFFLYVNCAEIPEPEARCCDNFTPLCAHVHTHVKVGLSLFDNRKIRDQS